MVSPLYWFFFYDSGKQIVYDVRHVAQGLTLQIEDILQMAAQMVDIQPLKRALGGNILGVNRMERIQESRLTILERWHSPYERRSELMFGSMESPLQHVVQGN
jgi:hypothetical protein